MRRITVYLPMFERYTADCSEPIQYMSEHVALKYQVHWLSDLIIKPLFKSLGKHVMAVKIRARNNQFFCQRDKSRTRVRSILLPCHMEILVSCKKPSLR